MFLKGFCVVLWQSKRKANSLIVAIIIMKCSGTINTKDSLGLDTGSLLEVETVGSLATSFTAPSVWCFRRFALLLYAVDSGFCAAHNLHFTSIFFASFIPTKLK